MSAIQSISADFDHLVEGYRGKDQPLAAYATLMSLYGIAFAGFVYAVKKGDVTLVDHCSLSDILLVGIAAHQLTRIIALDEVTSAARSPFTVYEGPGDIPSEVKEHPRGKGMQKAIGTLISCPFCLAPWVGVIGVVGLLTSPKITRAVATVFTIAAISNWLNLGYTKGWKK
jgi:hypothetical protein